MAGAFVSDFRLQEVTFKLFNVYLRCWIELLLTSCTLALIPSKKN